MHVAVAYGGVSPEHGISVESGHAVIRALAARRDLDVSLLFIDRSGGWHFGEGRPGVGLEAVNLSCGAAMRAGEGLSELLRRHVDLVFIALHGRGGEDGSFQALLAWEGIPFTGSSPAASALTMDKHLAKEVVGAQGFPVPRGILIERGGGRGELLSGDTVVEEILAEVGLPCFVKPNESGSSLATCCVRSVDLLGRAVQEASAADRHGAVLVEEAVEGRELSVGVIGARGAEQTLPPLEIRPVGRPFFDFFAKYSPGAAEEICPANLELSLARRVRHLALQIHRRLGCSGMSRVDFIIRDSIPMFLEVNSIPGLTKNSLLPKMAGAVGIDFPGLVDHVMRAATDGQTVASEGVR